MTSPSQANNLQVFFSTPSYNSNTQTLTVSNIQIIGDIGSVYFLLVLYKQIGKNAAGQSYVNIRMNSMPTAEQVLNCKNWRGETAEGCGRVVFSGVQSLSISFTGITTQSLYMLYYMPATEFPLRPIVSGSIKSETIVTLTWSVYAKKIFFYHI